MSARLERVIELLRHAERLYAACGPEAKTILNNAVFEGFWLDQGPEPDRGAVVADAPLTPVVGAVAAAGGAEDAREESGHNKTPGPLTRAGGFNVSQLAEDAGFEPARA